MKKPQNETVYYQRGPIRVTSHTLTTRFKDEPLTPDKSIIVGRDPFWMAGVVALGLLLFANRFGDLLFWHEQILLVAVGITVAVAGYCTATLQIGQHMRERTVLVAPAWVVNDVRRAIAKAREANGHGLVGTIITGDDAE